MIVTIIGGTASGKSEIAEDIALKLGGNLCYFATMKPYSNESLNKIKRHQELRKNKNFYTIEYHTNIDNIQINKYNTALFECITNFAANILFDEQHENPFNIFIKRINLILSSVDNIVFVTGNVFSDTLNYNQSTLKYLKFLSLVNNYLSEKSQVVIESVVGIPYFIKGSLNYD